MGFIRKDIKGTTPLDLKNLNDNIKYLWLKAFGQITSDDIGNKAIKKNHLGNDLSEEIEDITGIAEYAKQQAELINIELTNLINDVEYNKTESDNKIAEIDDLILGLNDSTDSIETDIVAINNKTLAIDNTIVEINNDITELSNKINTDVNNLNSSISTVDTKVDTLTTNVNNSIEDINFDLGTKVSNNDFSSYKLQQADLIASKVSNSDFETYQVQTANDISSKVASSEFTSYKTQTDNAILDRVTGDEFDSYKLQTANEISSKVSNNDFTTYQTQTSELIGSKVSNEEYETYKTQTATDISSKVSNTDFESFQTQTAESIASKVTNTDYESYKLQQADLLAEKVGSSDFESYKVQTDNEIVQRVRTTDFKRRTYIPNYSGLSVTRNAPVLNPLTGEVVTANTLVTLDTSSNISYEAEIEITGGNIVTYDTPTDRIESAEAEIIHNADMISQRVTQGDFESYQIQTAQDISSKVGNAEFNTYKTQTDNLIASKVDNEAYTSYIAQTADAIASKVSGDTFDSYVLQTNQSINSKISSAEFETYKTQTSQLIASKVSSDDYATYATQTDESISAIVTENGNIKSSILANTNSISLLADTVNINGTFFNESGLYTGSVTANQVNTGKLSSINGFTYFDLTNNKFRLGKSATEYLMDFNGTTLTFGSAVRMSWTQIDNKPTIPAPYTDQDALDAWISSGYKTYIDSNGIYTGTVATQNLRGNVINFDNGIIDSQTNGFRFQFDSSNYMIVRSGNIGFYVGGSQAGELRSDGFYNVIGGVGKKLAESGSTTLIAKFG